MRAGIMDIYAVFMVTTYSFFAFEQMCAMLTDLCVCVCVCVLLAMNKHSLVFVYGYVLPTGVYMSVCVY